MTEEAKGPCDCHGGSCVRIGTMEERIAIYKRKSQPITIPTKKKNKQRSVVPLLKPDQTAS